MQSRCKSLPRFYTESKELRSLRKGGRLQLSEAESKHALRYVEPCSAGLTSTRPLALPFQTLFGHAIVNQVLTIHPCDVCHIYESCSY